MREYSMKVGARQPGFILMFTMMILAAGVVLVSAVALRVHNAIKERRFLINREAAKIAAMGGVELVRTRLTHPDDPKENDRFLLWLLTNHDRWQEYALPEALHDNDRVQVRVQIEAGKINLNSFYDRRKKAFVLQPGKGSNPFWEGVAKWVGAVSGGQDDFYTGLSAALKEQKEPLTDLTQLFASSVFSKFSLPLFPAPPRKGEDFLSSDSAFSDLFTFVGRINKKHFVPLFFTQALQKVCELKPFAKGKSEQEEWAKKIIKKMGSGPIDWAKHWDALIAPSYKIKFQDFIKKYSCFSGAFAVDGRGRESLVSVVSYGLVGGVVQGVYALLAPYSGADSMNAYVIQQLYWI